MKTLQDYRKRIDALDEAIIKLLQERFEIVKEVGNYKAKNNMDVVQTARVQEVLDRVRALASAHNINPDLLENLYQEMIDHAHEIEDGIRKDYEKR